jgi:hypothetical protein
MTLWFGVAQSAFGEILESEGRFFVGAFGRNLISLAVKMLIVFFWVVISCSLVETDRRFRGASCLHHHGDPRRQSSSYSPP